jgi:hypothetical protein
MDQPKEGYFMLSHQVYLVVLPGQTDGVVVLTRGGNGLTMNLKEWLDLYRHQEDINDIVHEQWRGVVDNQDNMNFAWKGFPKNLLEHASAIQKQILGDDGGASNLIAQSFGHILRAALDQKMKALPVGENKRVRVRFGGHDTQVHFYTYDDNLAIVNLMQLTFDEWIELYKQMSEINLLTQNRLYIEQPELEMGEASA